MTHNRVVWTLGIIADLGLISALAAPPVHAATQYWDAVSGKTALTGSGNGDWGTNNVWVANTTSTTPGPWTSGNLAVFDAAGTSNVTVNSAISAANVELADGSQPTGSSITVNFSGGSSLVKTGGGVLVLSGTNSYLGGTIVDAGTLVVDNPNALPDGSSLAVGQGASTILGLAVAAPAAGVSAAPVPEPGTLALVAAALALVGCCLRRRRTA